MAHKFTQNDPIKRLTVEQQKELEGIKSGTKLTTDFLKNTGLDKVIDNWIENTNLGKSLKVGIVDYISMGGEVYYDYKLYNYKGVNKYEFQFRLVTNLGKGFIAGHFGSLAGAAAGAKYGSFVGGLVGSAVGAGIGWYIDNTYIRGIIWADKYFTDFGNNLRNQMIFNISNSR